MGPEPHIWVRHEVRPEERRAPLVPADAARLVGGGATVTVEESPARVFPDEEYAAAGCRIVPAGTWPDAPDDCFILGLKDPGRPAGPPRHRHIYFAHAFKGQYGSAELLGAFAAGGGTLLDLEHLVDEAGRRLVAFGYWAGYAGAALAVLHARGRLDAPLRPARKAELDAALREPGARPATLVTGALGRCGRGARDALEVAGIEPTRWDVAETRRLDRRALLEHELLVHAVGTSRPAEPFVTTADLERGDRRLATIADVTCDVRSACHLLPCYDRTTRWERPVLRLPAGGRPVDVIAIDNLPSLLPAEASTAFSAGLAPLLAGLTVPGHPAWTRCERAFRRALWKEAGVA
ncbi:saccharopine dehydrogenase [Actinomadura sp. KC06]|uniref:saccharopine dehydrogenase n=1 Tax=Actinomadura sp. KC06 TaxID=2530369 RepID=UPI001053F267|nr:saccharopine dehydrogenase [Actinomadura sp. KC06]TDD34954.1 saccharopine dehydrogenase [Actinomadura sp. KC06]